MKKGIAITIWFLLCISVLVFAYIQKEINDTDIAFFYLMIGLTFPSGLLLAFIVGSISYLLYFLFQVTIPAGFTYNFVLWVIFISIGYIQWFKVIPKVYRAKNNKFT